MASQRASYGSSKSGIFGITPVPRLHSSDLEVLGLFLFGPRWQRPLARALRRSDRLVRYWKSGRRPVSVAASARIEELVRSKHGEQMRRLRATHPDMIAGLSDTAIRGRLLAMDLGELHLDNHLRQRALIEADLAHALATRTLRARFVTIAPTNSSAALIERIVADLHSVCSRFDCARQTAARGEAVPSGSFPLIESRRHQSYATVNCSDLAGKDRFLRETPRRT
jgi:hypothetical protein